MKQWPVNKAYFWETAPFFRLLLPFITGILAYPLLHISHITACVCIGVCLISYITVAFLRRQTPPVRIAHFVLLHILLFFAAWEVCYLNDIRHSGHWFGRQLNHATVFAAQITDVPAEKEKTWKLKVQLLDAVTNEYIKPATGNGIVYVFKNFDRLTLQQGDTILLPNKWQPIKNAGNPFEFDYATYCARNNLYYQQFIAPEEIKVLARANISALSFAARAHNWCMLQLERFIHDKAALGLIQAMLVGDEANLDTDLRNAYAETGIIHVIAISGSHIAFFFFIITFLLGWIKSKKYHWVKYALALPLIWGYVLMAGAPPSAVRAALMFSILGIGFALQKQHNTLNQLFATGFFLLCIQPMWLYSVGFQLSFLAVLSLVIFYKPLYHLLHPRNIILKALWGTIVASIAAEILVAPLVVWYFHIFPLLFLVANVAAFLLMGIVLVAGMFIIALSFMPPVAGFITTLTVWMITVFHKFVFVIQSLNPPSFRFLNLQAVELTLLYSIIILTAVYFLHRKRYSLLMALTASVLLFGSLCYNQWQALHQQRLVVYNINGVSRVETIEGKYYNVLYTDSITPMKASYSLNPAHTGWYAWQQKNNSHHENMVQIGRQSVLLLNEPIYINAIHIDHVIVNFRAKAYQLIEINSVFSPRTIVLSNHVSRRQSEHYKQLCDSLKIPLHATQTDGAFVLPAL